MEQNLCVTGLRYRYHLSEPGWLFNIGRMEITPNTVFSLMGDNMSGKSTLLRLIAGTLPSEYGRCHGTLEWKDLRVSMPAPASAMRRRGLVMLNQNDAMFPALSIIENLALSAPDRISRESAFRAAHDKLEVFRQLYPTKVSNRMSLGTLSGGGQALLRLLRVLAWNHHIVLLDEPTVNLDADNRDRVFRLLRRFLAENASVVMVSHLREDHERLWAVGSERGMQRGQWQLTGGCLSLENSK